MMPSMKSRLTTTSNRGEADVSVSEDGTLVTYMATYIDPPNDYTEIWVGNSDGSGHRRVYVGGKNKVTSVHDPEISPDNQYVVFSQVDPNFHIIVGMVTGLVNPYTYSDMTGQGLNLVVNPPG